MIFVDNETSQNINCRFLAHDFPTDVIAFNYDDDDDETWGEVYVNVERAREQSVEYGVRFENELARLIIHGLLHLMGYNDQDPASKTEMQAKEDRLVQEYYPVLTGVSKNS